MDMRSLLLLLTPVLMAAADPAAWSKWRGPDENGLAKGAAPTEWSDTKNVAWKVPIAGRGHSSPVLWGDLLFLTTAVPVGEAPPPAAGAGGRGAGGGAASGVPHKFLAMAIDRKTGKTVWHNSAGTTRISAWSRPASPR